LDAKILKTDGFSIFKDKRMAELLKRLADERGVVVLTDSDSAGFRIRNYLRSVLAGKNVKNAFIPDKKGKEPRKAAAGREGLLGVEGMEKEIILTALKNAGCAMDAETGSIERREGDGKIEKADLYEMGLCGRPNSAAARKEILKELDLPEKMSANMFLDCLNLLFGKEAFLTFFENKIQ
jgi:ribonuclease M5